MRALLEHLGHIGVAQRPLQSPQSTEVALAGAIDRGCFHMWDHADFGTNVTVGASQTCVSPEHGVCVVGVDREHADSGCLRVEPAQAAILVAQQAVVGVVGLGGGRAQAEQDCPQQPGDDTDWHSLSIAVLEENSHFGLNLRARDDQHVSDHTTSGFRQSFAAQWRGMDYAGFRSYGTAWETGKSWSNSSSHRSGPNGLRGTDCVVSASLNSPPRASAPR